MDSDYYRSLKETGGLVTRLNRGRIALSGDDRATYLQGLLTNDIVSLPEGHGCYAVYLTPQGRIVADAEVFNVGDRLLLDVHGSVKQLLVDRFEELIFTEDVSIEDWTDTWTGYVLAGPKADSYLAKVLPQTSAQIGRWPINVCQQLSIGGASLIVSHSDPFGIDGFYVWAEREAAEELRRMLLEAGCSEVDEETADVVRIEQGRPVFPNDLNAEVIPLEAGIENRAISFTKGCYVGQEVVVRILHRGQGRLSRKLIGLQMKSLCDPSSMPSAGGRLWSGTETVGQITSVGFSGAIGIMIGLGYVNRKWIKPGTLLHLDTGAERVPAEVTALPFAD